MKKYKIYQTLAYDMQEFLNDFNQKINSSKHQVRSFTDILYSSDFQSDLYDLELCLKKSIQNEKKK